MGDKPFLHNYELVVLGEYLEHAEPQRVYEWLEERRSKDRWSSSIPHTVLPILQARNEPLITLGLAQYCSHDDTLRALFREGDLPVKCAVLANPLHGEIFSSIGEASHFTRGDLFDSNEDVLDFLSTAADELLEAYFSNSSISVRALTSTGVTQRGFGAAVR